MLIMLSIRSFAHVHVRAPAQTHAQVRDPYLLPETEDNKIGR